MPKNDLINILVDLLSNMKEKKMFISHPAQGSEL